MSLPSLSLKRPVFAIVMNIIIVIFGIVGFNFLGVRDFPAIDPPIVNVRTSYAGANSDIIETQITEPLEKSINGIAGIKNISSSSSQGTSNITVEFELGIDLEAATNDVRDKVSQALRNLPPDIDAPPVVSKEDANSDYILSMTLQSNTRNQLEITEYANNVLLERLQTIPGVSSIRILGEKKYAMRLWMDPARLSAYSLTPSDVQAALARENVELPSGKIAGNATELTVRTFGRLNTEEDFNNLIIKNVNSSVIHFRDIGQAVLGPENEETILKESGVPMIALALTPQPGSNYVAITDEFYKRYEQLKKDLPPDLSTNIAIDNTRFIRKSIEEVEETLVVALVLVILIIYLFFRDWLMAFRPLVDIPVSLIAAFFIMYMCGFTINILTLLAIVLATGLVVDDGIVVTENIYKKIEAGMPRMQAAKEGSEEIFFAVIATSITLAFVFLPIVFLQGFVGRLFREFGIVVAGAVLISAFVSLTLTPVLNVKLGRKKHTHSWFYTKTEPFFTWMEDSYQSALEKFMKVRWIAILIILGCVAMIYVIFRNLQSELAPIEDRSQFRLSISAPEGTSYDYMERYMDGLTQFMIDSIPEKNIVLTVTAPGFSGGGAVNSGFANVVLTEPTERTRSQKEIVNMVNRNMFRFSEGKVFAIEQQTIQVGRRSGLPVSFVLQHINFDSLTRVLPLFLDEANSDPTFSGVDVDLKFNKPELRILINRAKASELGVSVDDISQTLQLALSNVRYGYFIRNGKQYQVMGQVFRGNRDKPTDLQNFYVRNSRGEAIQLDNVVTISEETSPPIIYHFNRYKSATISAGLAPGKTIGDGIDAMYRIYNDLQKKGVIDDSYNAALSGSSRDYAESGSNTMFALVLALVLIYLVLAAQFESWVDPFIIMLTVPLAFAGALFSLWVFGQTWNIFSQIGVIMLIGLVTKNGILIVEFANHKRDEGLEKATAAIIAATMRLRPILMTSLAMALGALPIAMSLGAAATSRIPLGIVIVGGIVFSLVLTLFVIPAMYIFLSRRKPVTEPVND
ncbi:MAG: acriflavin resistance protein [Bacteroidetes bacterium]|uniref:efflux RND transporter permease subunit n=1 Tax=unclassified Chitinophaga TaxID=2619133 RepID=UPI0009C7D16C|nr:MULTISPECIES: efflux RND transporter permease subunit [unclassified Chitinophaga]MBP1651123.1 acriflavin resistance protein [Bacteroidota bacterium]OMP79513.1 acriflavin resistance protein [[Flexibacter] sp. ATCC 35208]WPV68333.1 efflux RND transporter permease subunit [Chitinophaga sp. LS1]